MNETVAVANVEPFHCASNASADDVSVLFRDFLISSFLAFWLTVFSISFLISGTFSLFFGGLAFVCTSCTGEEFLASDFCPETGVLSFLSFVSDLLSGLLAGKFAAIFGFEL